MACHELAALRLGLMNLIGLEDDHGRKHDLAELGTAINIKGPIQSLAESGDLHSLKAVFADAVSDLERKLNQAPEGDPKKGYHQTLLVLPKKVQLDLDAQIAGLTALFKGLDEVHHIMHEIYPSP